LHDAGQLVTDGVAGLLSLYLQWRRAASIDPQMDRRLFRSENTILMDIDDYPFG
jgi:hypothetical protein